MQSINDADIFGEPELEFCCSVGLQGEILFTTPAMTTFLAYEREELETRPFAELVHPDDQSGTLKQLSALKDKAEKIDFTARYKASCGKYSMLHWSFERCGSMYTATAKVAD